MSSKISALTAILGVNVDPAADVLAIVDTSATQTKKILVEEILRALGNGTAAAPSLAFINSPGAGFYRTANNEIGIALASSLAYLFAATAFLGTGLDLGTTTLRWQHSYAKVQHTGQGADVAAANNLSLGSDGNKFNITGATQINLLDRSNWLAGDEVTLLFAGTPTVKHGQTTSGNNTQILLAGAVDFVASANDVLTLVLWSDDIWREKSRAVI